MPNGDSGKYIFLDRDGTINLDTGYVCNPEELVLLEGAAEAIALLRNAGFSLIIVTNQSAIGRGYAKKGDVESTNARLLELLLAESPDAEIDEVIYCPHSPEDGCLCRKPKTGMIEGHGVSLFGFPLCFTTKDLAGSWMIGDKFSDLEFGKNIGIPFEQRIYLDSSHGESSAEFGADGRVPRTFRSLLVAAREIVGLSLDSEE